MLGRRKKKEAAKKKKVAKKRVPKKKVVKKKKAGGKKKAAASPKATEVDFEKVEAARLRQAQGAAQGPKGLREISSVVLEEILGLHREWITSKGKEGERANLSRAYLREV